jgi:hypothetical protein
MAEAAPQIPPSKLTALIAEFESSQDANAKDKIWQGLSAIFRKFWDEKILDPTEGPIPDAECDVVIRILDRNGKGNTPQSEAVARAMITQHTWRRILNELHSNRPLGSLVFSILKEPEPAKRATLIDELYRVNQGKANHLTGPSGNAICAFMAAYDPLDVLSIISLKDRRSLIEYFNFPVSLNWESSSMGLRIVESGKAILTGLHGLGVTGSASTLSRFCYFAPVRALWKAESTVKTPDGVVSVTVPAPPESSSPSNGDEVAPEDEIRESFQIQALLAKIGSSMGFKIWLPRGDRGRVLKAWSAGEGELIDELPLGYDSVTLKTVEQIDVLWLKSRTVARAFEVEHSTAIYSGLLRMADLVALQPNTNIRLHIVAPDVKRDKVFQEINRPVFSLADRPLRGLCTFLSYDSVRELADNPFLTRLRDGVLDDYQEIAEA